MERDGKGEDDGWEERETGTGGGDVDGARVPENGTTETRAGERDADAGDAATPREGDGAEDGEGDAEGEGCLLYTSPSPRDLSTSRMPSSA